MDSAILAKAKVTLPHHAQLTTCKRENNSICFVISGVLTLEALLHDGRRQVLGFRYPGDLAPSALRHVLPASNIVAAIDAELIDLSKLSRDTACAASAEEIKQCITDAKKRERERATLQTLILGRLTSEERIASFLLEIILRGGRCQADRILFPFPMTREDIADYLCLNADTVSRLLSRVRKQQVFTLIGTRQAFTTNIHKICDMTPLAAVIIHCYGAGQESLLA